MEWRDLSRASRNVLEWLEGADPRRDLKWDVDIAVGRRPLVRGREISALKDPVSEEMLSEMRAWCEARTDLKVEMRGCWTGIRWTEPQISDDLLDVTL